VPNKKYPRMKANIFFWSLLLLATQVIAQVQKTNGVSASPTQVNFADHSKTDYNPNLIFLDQHPIPSAEYGNKKEAINKLRQQKEVEGFLSEKKKRGLALNPTIVKGIQGNTANGVPNDNDIAVSNDGKVVSVVNSNMRIYDDTGKTLLNKSLTNLVAPAGVFSWISDPRVIYDPIADKFILVCFSGSLSTESTILVGFTQTNDPAGIWNIYTLNGASFNDSTWSDYPIISISDKDLFITFNQVKDNVSWTIGFKQSVIWQIKKSNGYTGIPLQYTLWSNINFNGAPLRNICPAKNQSSTMGNNMYFLTLRNVDMSNDSIFVNEITDSYESGNATITQKVLVSPVAYGFPPNAREKSTTIPGNYLMTNDARVLAAIYENDYIYFGSNTVNPLYMNAGVYLGNIKNISSPTPTVNADIISSASIEYGYASMTYIGQAPNEHKIMYTFSHCYVDSFPGTSVLYKDAQENYSDIIAVKNGTSYINVLSDSTERWGDYTNIQKMYNNPNRIYLAGSWGKSGGMNNWITILDNKDYPTAITTLEKQNEHEVFPNPISEKRFTTKFTMDKTQKVRFEMLDIQGKVISQMLYTRVKAGANEFSFSISDLAQGMYLFRMKGDDGYLSTEKVMVK